MKKVMLVLVAMLAISVSGKAQADAEFVFTKGGAIGASYFALIATGPNWHCTAAMYAAGWRIFRYASR